MSEADPERIAAVLEQIADHSSDADIRNHLRVVVVALRGGGVVFLNGPPQQEMRDAAR